MRDLVEHECSIFIITLASLFVNLTRARSQPRSECSRPLPERPLRYWLLPKSRPSADVVFRSLDKNVFELCNHPGRRHLPWNQAKPWNAAENVLSFDSVDSERCCCAGFQSNDFLAPVSGKATCQRTWTPLQTKTHDATSSVPLSNWSVVRSPGFSPHSSGWSFDVDSPDSTCSGWLAE